LDTSIFDYMMPRRMRKDATGKLKMESGKRKIKFSIFHFPFSIFH